METPELIKDLYTKPFIYVQDGTCILDSNGERVLDIRGWGRLQYLEHGADKQDALGMYVCDLLNMNYV